MFSMSIFSVDHYMSSPILGLDPTYSHFRGKEVKQVPILRIFGANQTGHKTCLHVHGVFPYIHIPHDETSLEATEKLCYRVATSLDKAINILMGQSDSTMQHVFDVTPVAGVPMYGYHDRKHQFLKIRFFNPFTVKKAATLFQNGTILEHVYQPHDAHINYELQFMIDYNLHGMNNIYLFDVKYRIDQQIDSSIIDNISTKHILNENVLRISTCKYEIDCLSENIINLQEVNNGKLGANPGIAAIWEEERNRRQLQNKDTQDIAPTASQFRPKLKDTTSEIFFKNRLKDRLESLKSLRNSNVSSIPPSSNQSIYPLEVSEQNQFLDASIAHLIQNPEVSITPELKNLNESFVNENLILSLTQECSNKDQPILNDIYNVLMDLVDEDSILSQHPINEHEVIVEDEIEQESHDLEQTLIEDNEMFSSNDTNNQKQTISHELGSHLINEMFSSNDSFLRQENVSQFVLSNNLLLEKSDDLERTLCSHTYSDDTLIESEKQYSIFYDDIIENRKNDKVSRLKASQISFSQFSDLDSVIINEMTKFETNLSSEESIIYSSDSEELLFDGKWKNIPQIDGINDLNKKQPKHNNARHTKRSGESEIIREMLCESTGKIYKIEPVQQTAVHNVQERKYLKNRKPSPVSSVQVLKIEQTIISVDDLTRENNYMPVQMKSNFKNNNISKDNFILSMPNTDESNNNILNQDDSETITSQYKDLSMEFDQLTLNAENFENTTELIDNVSSIDIENYEFEYKCIKGLLAEMINAISPDETYEIFPESSCHLYHKMNATFFGQSIPIDIQCSFLQNIREYKFKQVLNPDYKIPLNYILKLNRDLKPIAIDTYDNNCFKNTKTTFIDKEKFLRSLLYDNSIEITNKHIILHKNGKIIVKEKDSISEKVLIQKMPYSSSSIFRSKSCQPLIQEGIKSTFNKGITSLIVKSNSNLEPKIDIYNGSNTFLTNEVRTKTDIEKIDCKIPLRLISPCVFDNLNIDVSDRIFLDDSIVPNTSKSTGNIMDKDSIVDTNSLENFTIQSNIDATPNTSTFNQDEMFLFCNDKKKHIKSSKENLPSTGSNKTEKIIDNQLSSNEDNNAATSKEQLLYNSITMPSKKLMINTMPEVNEESSLMINKTIEKAVNLGKFSANSIDSIQVRKIKNTQNLLHKRLSSQSKKNNTLRNRIVNLYSSSKKSLRLNTKNNKFKLQSNKSIKYLRKLRINKNKQKLLIQQNLRNNLQRKINLKSFIIEKYSQNSFIMERTIIQAENNIKNITISLINKTSINDSRPINYVTHKLPQKTLNDRWKYDNSIFVGIFFDPEILSSTKIVIPNIKLSSNRNNRIIFSFKPYLDQFETTDIKSEPDQDLTYSGGSFIHSHPLVQSLPNIENNLPQSNNFVLNSEDSGRNIIKLNSLKSESNDENESVLNLKRETLCKQLRKSNNVVFNNTEIDSLNNFYMVQPGPLSESNGIYIPIVEKYHQNINNNKNDINKINECEKLVKPCKKTQNVKKLLIKKPKKKTALKTIISKNNNLDKQDSTQVKSKINQTKFENSPRELRSLKKKINVNILENSDENEIENQNNLNGVLLSEKKKKIQTKYITENVEKISKKMPARQAKINACNNITSHSPLRKSKEVTIRFEDKIENFNEVLLVIPKLNEHSMRSQKNKKIDKQIQSKKLTSPVQYDQCSCIKVPGIDGMFSIESSSEEYLTDSSEDSLLLEKDIIFVDGLNDKKKISNKYNLRECSVILSKFDDINSKMPITLTNKRKLRDRQKKLTETPGEDQSNVGKCRYEPLDIILTKSPTSRNLKESEKRGKKIQSVRKRLKLNFDNQPLSTNNQDLQKIAICYEDNNLNLKSSSEGPSQFGTGEFSVQHFEPQSLESPRIRRISKNNENRMNINLNRNKIDNLKHNQNEKNLIKNSFDNNSAKCDLVYNAVGNSKFIRRSLRNRTLISETKKTIKKQSSISNLKTSTPINEIKKNRLRRKTADLNYTVAEENKECSLNQSPKSRKISNVINISQISCEMSQKVASESNYVQNYNSEEPNVSCSSSDPKESTLISTSKSQSGISKILSENEKIEDDPNSGCISPRPEHEVKLLISPKKSEREYTNAYEYDKKNNFFPQPGCSKAKFDHEMLLRHLQDLEDISSSSEHEKTIRENLSPVLLDTKDKSNDNSQAVALDDYEKSSTCNETTQKSEYEVESFYDVTFADCTKIEEEFEENKKSNVSTFHCAQDNNEFDHKSKSMEMRLSLLSFTSDSNLSQNRLHEKLDTQNLSTVQFNKSTNRFTTDGFVVLMPKFNPPTYSDIQNSFVEYNLPEVRYESPFYSVPSDAIGRIEIGHKILKVPSKCVQDLPEFTSELELDSITIWRKRKLDNIQSTQNKNVQGIQCLASNREILITPNNNPPSVKDVETWLKAKKYIKEHKQKHDKPIKIRLKIPCSPGNDDNSDNDDSLTLTPCTPKVLSNESETMKISTNNSLDTFSEVKNSTNLEQSPSIVHKSTKHISKNKRVKIALAKSFANKSQQKLSPKDSTTLADETLLDHSVESLLNNPQCCKDLNTPNTYNNSSCLITGATLNNTHGFKVPLENFQDVKAMVKHQYLTTMILELHIKTRANFKPNPELDPIVAIFYSIYNDVPINYELPQTETGILCVGSRHCLGGSCNSDINIVYVESELELFEILIQLFVRWDPDILAGYEIYKSSWGYLLERSFHLQLNLPKRLSRIPDSRSNTRVDENGKMSDINFTGRLFLEIWRLMRHEIDLYSYSFENIVYHILHERIPKHSFKNLTEWFESTCNRFITVQYYLKRVIGVLSILDKLDFIGRTSELARLFGIQFYEVLSRGSQFRVESMMLRLTKPLNYIPVSPSVTQRAKMKAPEFLPLILEPDSRLYNDPIIVLDFQSLYPSMIIAYNYCFSTCLGRVSELGESHPFEFGATQLRVNPKLVESFLNNNKLNISPCGVAFVNDSVRQGILPRMLKEILDCRLMVKKSLKENKDDATLKRVLNSRQLGLKLIANVTYGYTAANFSGRMPCCELADSVVSKGRETLERAIQMVEKNEKWRAKVVYGDTDSLFVMTPGRSRKDAFEIGKEIAEAVTGDNPTPVKLKLEKIYQPCILQTKKRYVGYMYESPDQEEPVYNAKGIETVRRDGCPAVAKILEKSLKILFETKDMSLVKQYVCRQFSKIITGRVNMQDLIFAREFRGMNGYRPGAMVPALELAKRYKSQDPRCEPLRSERVPYIIASGAPGTTLVRLAKGPHELIADPALKPHIQYYITKAIIPPLNRCLSLCGVDVHTWYKDLPRKYKLYFPTSDTTSKDVKKSTIAQHFATNSCVSCGSQTRDIICTKCIDYPQKTVIVLEDKLRKWERNLDNIKKICSSCCGRFENTDCISLDCPVLYRLTQAQRDYEQAPFVRSALFNKIDSTQSSSFTNSTINF